MPSARIEWVSVRPARRVRLDKYHPSWPFTDSTGYFIEYNEERTTFSAVAPDGEVMETFRDLDEAKQYVEAHYALATS